MDISERCQEIYTTSPSHPSTSITIASLAAQNSDLPGISCVGEDKA